MKKEKQRYDHFAATANTVINNLITLPGDELNGKLFEAASFSGDIECVYVLDKSDIQISNTIFPNRVPNLKDNLLFFPADTGADHSVKSYFYQLANSRMNEYLTEPYTSLATGNICTTFSRFFENAADGKHILCVDYKV